MRISVHFVMANRYAIGSKVVIGKPPTRSCAQFGKFREADNGQQFTAVRLADFETFKPSMVAGWFALPAGCSPPPPVLPVRRHFAIYENKFSAQREK